MKPLTKNQQTILIELSAHLPANTYMLCKLLGRDMKNQTSFRMLLERISKKGYLRIRQCKGGVIWFKNRPDNQKETP